MKDYLTDDEVDELFGKWIDALYDSFSENTKIIYEKFLCETKRKLKDTLTTKQMEIFEFLEQNIDVYETAITEEAFAFGYRLGMKEYMEN